MSGKAAEHSETQDLTRGPIARQIVTLAAPHHWHLFYTGGLLIHRHGMGRALREPGDSSSRCY